MVNVLVFEMGDVFICGITYVYQTVAPGHFACQGSIRHICRKRDPV